MGIVYVRESFISVMGTFSHVFVQMVFTRYRSLGSIFSLASFFHKVPMFMELNAALHSMKDVNR